MFCYLFRYFASVNEKRREITRERLNQSRSYTWLQKMADLMDRYYLDAALGFAIPGGIGDAITAIVSLAFVGFSVFGVRSVSLSLAVMNNVLRDLLLGLITFYVGDVIDVFHKSNQQNMSLIKGFVDGDEAIIKTVNKKAAWSVVIFICLCVLIYLMFRLLFWLGEQVISIF